MKANMLSLHTPTTPWGGVKRSYFFFFKSSHVAYQIKLREVKTYMQGNTFNLHIHLTSGVRLKGQILKLCRLSILFFKISNKTYLTYLTGVCYVLNDTEDELQV